MVFDWSKKTTRLRKRLFSTIICDGEEHIFFADAKRDPVEYKTFKNFAKLHIEENQLIGCVFEDCEEIWIDSKWLTANCIFNRVKRIHTNSKELKECRFNLDENVTSSYLDARNCWIHRCIFEGVVLMNKASLVEERGKTFVTSSKFINKTDRTIIELENSPVRL